MGKKKNKYAQKAHRKQMLGSTESASYKTPEKGDFAKSGIALGRDVLIGAIGGGLTGAILGRSSFLLGILTTGAGHYFGSPGAAGFGIGMMVSGGYRIGSGINGPEAEGMEGVKERIKAFGQDLKQKLFLDKIIKPKEKTSEETSMGEVQYFTYPNDKILEGALDMSALDKIERQLEVSAQNEQMRLSGLAGDLGDVTEMNL